MTPSPQISIVLPVYNRAEQVKRTLESIERQAFRPFNVILVDNNSSDDSLQVLQQWADRVGCDDMPVTVLSCKTPGAAAARNAGLDVVDTPWVMFFDSDDTMAPDHLQAIAHALDTRREADLVGWDVRMHFLDGSSAVKPFYHRNLLYYCILEGALATLRYICRTDIVKGIGGWDPHLSTWDDIELGTRILTGYPSLRVYKIKGAPRVDVYVSDESITGATFHASAEATERALHQMSCNIKPCYQYMTALKQVILAAHYKREGFPDDAGRLRRQALRNTGSLWYKALLQLAYAYTAAGGRGAARILRPFFG